MENKDTKQFYLFVKGEKVAVSEEVYRAYVRADDSAARSQRRNSKCLVKGERKGLVRCKRNCEECPYYSAGNKLLGGVLSLDGLIEEGYEEVADTDIENDLIVNEEKEKMLNALPKAIASLNERQQYIVKAIYFQGKTQLELSQELKVSQVAIFNILGRAKAKLKKFLENF